MAMLSKYHRNAILTGYIDAYCLVCESHLRSHNDIDSHIAKPIHTKNLEATGFLDRYKDDCVRKVKKGYYCEFCNLLLTTAAKVGLHIAEEKHTNNKGSQCLRRIGNKIIAFKNLVINEEAWHGIIDDTCTICNVEFDNENLHKTDSTHILNLVQSKIKFGGNNGIYRKIDESSYQCLTCNEVLAINSLATHFYGTSHEKHYLACQQDDIDEIPDAVLNVDKDKDVTIEPPKSEPKNPAPTGTTTKTSSTIAPPKSEPKNPAPTGPTAKTSSNIAPPKSEPKNPAATGPTAKTSSTIAPPKSEPKNPAPTGITAKTTTAKNIPKSTCLPVICVKKSDSSENAADTPAPLEILTEDLDEAICKVLGAKDYIDDGPNGKKWCLLCEWAIDPYAVQAHLSERHHKVLLKMHKKRIEKKKMAAASQNSEPPKEELKSPTDQENKDKIVEVLSRLQFYEFNISFDKKSIFCNKCSQAVEFDHNIVEQHIEGHKTVSPKKEPATYTPVQAIKKTEDPKKDEMKKPLPPKPDVAKKAQSNKDDKGSRASSVASNRDNEEEIEKFVKAHELVYNRGDTKVYCRVCDSQVPSSLKNMKEHVSGLSHKNKMLKWLEHKQSLKNVTVKKSMADFLRNVWCVENGVMRDVVINERYCINIYSFFMISCVDRLYCEVCEMNLSLEHLDEHKSLPHHKQVMSDMKIIVSNESEFLREVRPQVYHCGFCNMTFRCEDLPTHLAKSFHREAKTSANWRLQQYLPDIVHNQKIDQYGPMLLMKMLSEQVF